MPVPRHGKHRVGIRANEVKQRRGSHHAEEYPSDNAPGSHATENDDGAADQNHQRRNLANRARNIAEEGIHPAYRLSACDINQRFTAAASPLGQRRRAGKAIRCGPHQIAGNLRRPGKEQKGPPRQRRVEKVTPGSAKDLLGHDDAKRDPERSLP